MNGAAGALGDGGAPTAARLRNPSRLRFDPNGNLYIAEDQGCRIRVWNREAGNISFGAATIVPGTLGTIVGNNAGNTCVNGGLGGAPLNAAGNLNRALGMDIAEIVAGRPTLFYVTSYSSADIRVVNFTGSLQSFGAVNVANNTIGKIIGLTASGGYTGEGLDASTKRVNNPICVNIDPLTDNIMFCDHGNLRLRYAEAGTNIANRLAGIGLARSVAVATVVDATLPTTEQIFGTPNSLVYDDALRMLFFSNQTVHRVTGIQRFGQGGTSIGTGNGGSAVNEDEVPTSALLNSPRGVALHDGDLIYCDSTNHVVRAWNRSSVDKLIFGTFVGAGRVSTIAGVNGVLGNGPFGVAATSSNFNSPGGVASDGTNLFISDTTNHCIKMLTPAGIVSAVAGTCGTSGTAAVDNQPATTIWLNSPETISTDANGNLYIADRANSRIRYVNLNTAPSIQIGLRTVVQGNMWTVACGGAVAGDDYATLITCSNPYGVASRPGQFCFSNQGHHNVRCVNIATGLLTTVFGRPPSNARAGAPLNIEQEGVAGSAALLNAPRGVAFDAEGYLYIADTGNHLIRKVYLGASP